jgi:hypothetical protein
MVPWERPAQPCSLGHVPWPHTPTVQCTHTVRAHEPTRSCTTGSPLIDSVPDALACLLLFILCAHGQLSIMT